MSAGLNWLREEGNERSCSIEGSYHCRKNCVGRPLLHHCYIIVTSSVWTLNLRQKAYNLFLIHLTLMIKKV
jgi:hypothetical protein